VPVSNGVVGFAAKGEEGAKSSLFGKLPSCAEGL